MLFGTILHAPPPTSFTAFLAVNVVGCSYFDIGETDQRLSDRFAEHIGFIRNNDVVEPVARHFNAANHSISDVKVCAISSISGGNDNLTHFASPPRLLIDFKNSK